MSRSEKSFTAKQGQYLAYIRLYTRLHRRPPAEIDMQEYFRVSPPSVHQMVLTLERAGFIRRERKGATKLTFIDRTKALRHPVEGHHAVGKLLDAVESSADVLRDRVVGTD